MLIIDDLDIIDPENDDLHYSCNLGSVTKDGIYLFDKRYPGEYTIQIIACDMWGGSVTEQFTIQVLPFWSL